MASKSNDFFLIEKGSQMAALYALPGLCLSSSAITASAHTPTVTPTPVGSATA